MIDAVTIPVDGYNTVVPDNKWINKLGITLDTYHILNNRNLFSIKNSTIRATDAYLDYKEKESANKGEQPKDK